TYQYPDQYTHEYAHQYPDQHAHQYIYQHADWYGHGNGDAYGNADRHTHLGAADQCGFVHGEWAGWSAKQLAAWVYCGGFAGSDFVCAAFPPDSLGTINFCWVEMG